MFEDFVQQIACRRTGRQGKAQLRGYFRLRWFVLIPVRQGDAAMAQIACKRGKGTQPPVTPDTACKVAAASTCSSPLSARFCKTES